MCNQESIEKQHINQIHSMNIQELGDFASTDVLVSQMIEQIESSPMGKLLKIMSSLPEIRTEKVECARVQMCKNDKKLDQELDQVLDQVLEGLLIP